MPVLLQATQPLLPYVIEGRLTGMDVVNEDKGARNVQRPLYSTTWYQWKILDISGATGKNERNR